MSGKTAIPNNMLFLFMLLVSTFAGYRLFLSALCKGGMKRA